MPPRPCARPQARRRRRWPIGHCGASGTPPEAPRAAPGLTAASEEGHQMVLLHWGHPLLVLVAKERPGPSAGHVYIIYII